MESRKSQTVPAVDEAEAKHFLIWIGLWIAALLVFLPR
jgi:hypothetical protein